MLAVRYDIYIYVIRCQREKCVGNAESDSYLRHGLSVYLRVRLSELYKSAPNGRIFIKVDGLVFFEVMSWKLKFH
jgi:hypothetical protein